MSKKRNKLFYLRWEEEDPQFRLGHFILYQNPKSRMPGKSCWAPPITVYVTPDYGSRLLQKLHSKTFYIFILHITVPQIPKQKQKVKLAVFNAIAELFSFIFKIIFSFLARLTRIYFMKRLNMI